jgi:hypothetical protein
MKARTYRPDVAQFLQQDRYADPEADLYLATDALTSSRYAFTAGNPSSRAEYDGHAFKDDSGRAAEARHNTNAIAQGDASPKRVAAQQEYREQIAYEDRYYQNTGRVYASANLSVGTGQAKSGINLSSTISNVLGNTLGRALGRVQGTIRCMGAFNGTQGDCDTSSSEDAGFRTVSSVSQGFLGDSNGALAAGVLPVGRLARTVEWLRRAKKTEDAGRTAAALSDDASRYLSKRRFPYPATADEQLAGAYRQIYRAEDKRPGGTAGELRRELDAGLRGRDTHIQKAKERRSQLNRILRTRTDLSSSDRRMAEHVRDDLSDAISYRPR